MTQEKLGVLINTEVGVTEWRSESKGKGRGDMDEEKGRKRERFTVSLVTWPCKPHPLCPTHSKFLACVLH